jgi:hypothetical protein
MASEITSTSLNAFTIVEEDHAPKNFGVYNVGPHQKICSTFHGDGFSMYEFVFKDLGLRLPFSPLAIDIFKFLKLAPSQLHPNAMAFVLAFQHLCEYKGVVPTRAFLPCFPAPAYDERIWSPKLGVFEEQGFSVRHVLRINPRL